MSDDLMRPDGCKCPNAHQCKAIYGVPYEKLGEIELYGFFSKVALSLSAIDFLALVVFALC